MRTSLIVILAVLISGGSAFAQRQCTDQDARQKVGSWNGRNRFGDEFANADRTFPRSQYLLILSKVDKVIAMLKAIPNPIGKDRSGGNQ
jgi:hypothetical protein